MCLAYPGKIISIKNKNQQAIADFSGVQKEINISLVNVKKNDYVIVHTGFAIQKLSKIDAFESLKLYKKLFKNKQLIPKTQKNDKQRKTNKKAS